MAQPKETIDDDFDAQLRGLFQQAERALEHRGAVDSDDSLISGSSEPLTPYVAATGAQPGSPAPANGSAPSLPQALRPLMKGLEAVVRATSDNTTALQKLETASASHTALDKDLPHIVSELRGVLDLKNGVNQSMFAALHEELKGYKDGFLLESVHRPIIRDLISLYDDTIEIHRQSTTAAAQCISPETLPLSVQIRTLEMNVDHNLDFLVEILARLEVTLLELRNGKLDKRTQRVVAVENAENAEEDGDVVRVVKRGFVWQSRTFRPEEVVIKKWKEGVLTAPEPAPQT